MLDPTAHACGELRAKFGAVTVDIAPRPAWEFRLTGAVVAWMIPLSMVLLALAVAGYGAVHCS